MDMQDNTLEFDPNGFMLNGQAWSEEIAGAIAKYDGLGPLTSIHWRIINELRHSWLDSSHALPAVSHVCHQAGLGPMCLEELFHGPREAWRIAGLPDPGEEARAYM
jgi:dissimilatory sulfite reductase related protein